MKTYQDLVTIVEFGPIETAITCVIITSVLLFFTMSAKTGVAGDVIGFDFSWIGRIFNRKRDGKQDE